MAKIKIFFEKGETERDAEDSLLKAMEFHNNGDAHAQEFQDPAMTSVAHRMEELHQKMYQEMLMEIFEALDQEYSDGNQ